MFFAIEAKRENVEHGCTEYPGYGLEIKRITFGNSKLEFKRSTRSKGD
jgi:hypothetical protein